MAVDWFEWHLKYEDHPRLQARLGAVREHLSEVMSLCPKGPIKVISLCAGDGRDLAGVVGSHPRRSDVSAYLVEMNPRLVAQGEELMARAGIGDRVIFCCADATQSDTYRTIAPGDIVIVAGVFGNLAADSVCRLIQSLCSLCKNEGFVVWTRRTNDDDDWQACRLICEQFSRFGFVENKLTLPHGKGFAVGTYRFHGKEQSLAEGGLFSFGGPDVGPHSSRPKQ